MMKTITCIGSPLEIGLRHGEEASVEISRSIEFYAGLFKETAKMSWDDVCQTASKFLPYLRREWPFYVEEMNGISQSAGVPFLSILALNVRTEIAYGLFSDGCTALAWRAHTTSFLAQNWDWQQAQAANLVRLKIHHHHARQPTRPRIDMITEAGIIGKIGLNSAGLGTCLNAIRAHGVDFDKLPVHLALRACLECYARDGAREMLHRAGVASACHILVADQGGSIGFECTHRDVVDLLVPAEGPQVVTHTNHFVRDHPGVVEVNDLPDSYFRLRRINELIATFQHKDALTIEDIRGFLKDEENFPASINRAAKPDCSVATLFSIAMDLGKKEAIVKIGRPTEGGEEIVLCPE